MHTHLDLRWILALALASCQSYQGRAALPRTTNLRGAALPQSRVPAAMKTDGEIGGLLTYGAPYRLPGQTSWISSFTVTNSRSLFRDSNPFSEGGLASKGRYFDDGAAQPTRLHSVPIGWHNAVFVDRASGEEWPLLSERGFLSKWWILLEPVPKEWKDEEGYKQASKALLFAATLVDSNGDGRLNDRDASTAVMTKGDGREARAVTPAGTQLSSVGFLADENALAFALRLDEDGDGVFEESDPVRLYLLSLDGQASMAQPWHGAQTYQVLQDLYR